ncbi:hypothetical protein [Pseudomonas abieticivorans]|uniref:hypothetical protein n=1 Tax=Pseudomonas abieticivorans TaxID=2931382 RepID=UPI0020BE6C23|nr:hypothetical protein [Pseudomonas sp. PIA16]
MTDAQTEIGIVIDTAYEALAFEAGSAPRWDLFREVFHESAILGLRVFPGDPEISILDLLQYMQAQVANGIKENGYSETVGERTIRIFGEVATVEQYFTMNFANAEAASAIDIFSLVRLDSSWWVVAVISDTAHA